MVTALPVVPIPGAPRLLPEDLQGKRIQIQCDLRQAGAEVHPPRCGLPENRGQSRAVLPRAQSPQQPRERGLRAQSIHLSRTRFPQRALSATRGDRQAQGRVLSHEPHIRVGTPPLCEHQKRRAQQLHLRVLPPQGVARVPQMLAERTFTSGPSPMLGTPHRRGPTRCRTPPCRKFHFRGQPSPLPPEQILELREILAVGPDVAELFELL
jgi:hypothetical protein